MTRNFRFFVFLICCSIIGAVLSPMVWAQNNPAIKIGDFKRLPILHEGRVKPIDAFARVELQRIYGRDHFHGLPAVEFMALALFDPALAVAAPLFPVRDAQLRQQLGIADRTARYFSLNDLQPGLQATRDLLPPLVNAESPLTESQKALLALHDHAITLMHIMGSLSTENDPNTAPFNHVLRVIPPDHDTQHDWRAPPQVNHNAPSLKPWLALRTAWKNGDQAGWDASVVEAQRQTKAHIDSRQIETEIFYRAVQPLQWAEWVYLLSFLSLIIGFFREPGTMFYRIAFWGTFAGAVAHLGAIILRVIILDRPPVATLYETLLFVSVVLIFTGLGIEFLRKNRLPLMAGLGAGIMLLLCAPAFAPLGDSMEVLVAVLNTGFWLSTHVICITIGYGVCLLAATLAHFALLQPRIQIDSLIHKIMIAGLFFTAFGTMLGGIWADQSWGRFWGWDPKENGALLIVLWIAWVLHGRWSGLLKGAYLNAAIAFLAVIVALAWFGVNLLNIGLHSYGFTESMAAALIGFCVIEISFITWAVLQARRGDVK